MVSPGIDMEHLNVTAAYFGLEDLCQMIEEKIKKNYEIETVKNKEETEQKKMLKKISSNIDNISDHLESIGSISSTLDSISDKLFIDRGGRPPSISGNLYTISRNLDSISQTLYRK